mmetsp:Transcript_103643/g.263226  ORF Transcript_103643/g.263226 Transcript_103643/m.263226 type:complete len:208 (+) Transcript_103643:230-853(+)
MPTGTTARLQSAATEAEEATEKRSEAERAKHGGLHRLAALPAKALPAYPARPRRGGPVVVGLHRRAPSIHTATRRRHGAGVLAARRRCRTGAHRCRCTCIGLPSTHTGRHFTMANRRLATRRRVLHLTAPWVGRLFMEAPLAVPMPTRRAGPAALRRRATRGPATVATRRPMLGARRPRRLSGRRTLMRITRRRRHSRRHPVGTRCD